MYTHLTLNTCASGLWACLNTRNFQRTQFLKTGLTCEVAEFFLVPICLISHRCVHHPVLFFHGVFSCVFLCGDAAYQNFFCRLNRWAPKGTVWLVVRKNSVRLTTDNIFQIRCLVSPPLLAGYGVHSVGSEIETNFFTVTGYYLGCTFWRGGTFWNVATDVHHPGFPQGALATFIP